jgi:hypothetical protein
MNEISFAPAVFSILLSMALSINAADDAPKRLLTVSLSSYFHYGRADGFLQTPAGGQPGTSSIRRPTLHELDVREVAFYDVLGFVQWRSLSLYAGYQAIGLDGDAVLSQGLISRGTTFPAGTQVQSQTDLNWFRIGAGWKFVLADGHWEILPKAEFAVLDFSYELSGGTQAVDRGYAKGCARLGLESRYRFNRIFGVSLNGEGSVPVSGTPQIAALTGLLEFGIFPRSRRIHPTLYLGGGAQRLEYEDNQRLPNHFRVDLGPFVTAGLSISF